MKQILILSFLILSNLNYGQLLLSNSDYYVYNNSKDTLYLTKIESSKNKNFIDGSLKSSKILDTIQIDGIDSKEIIFERSYSGESKNIMQAHQEEEFTKIHKYEIWNIDTKTLLFEAISFYEFRFENWSITTNSSIDNDGWNRGFCSYTYDFSIDSVGRIKISDTKVISTNKDCTPDKEEGFYIFRNGQYIKE